MRDDRVGDHRTPTVLALPSGNKPQILPGQHVAHDTFTPMDRHIAVEHGYTEIERAVEDNLDSLVPGVAGKLTLGPVVLPLVLRTQAPNLTSFFLRRRGEKPLDLCRRFLARP